MNKLRELIAKVKRQDSTFEEAIEYARWFNTHAEAIADLIDAAQKLPKGSTCVNLRTVVDDVLLNDIAQLISKLTEDK